MAGMDSTMPIAIPDCRNRRNGG